MGEHAKSKSSSLKTHMIPVNDILIVLFVPKDED